MHEAVQSLAFFNFFSPHTQAKFTSKKAEIAITTVFSEIFAPNAQSV